MPSRPPPPPPPRRGSITGSHRIQPAQRAGIADPGEHEHFARVNAAGELVAAHGNARRLAELSTYACNLADAVGALLEIGPCRAIEATYAGGRLVSMREPDGSVVGWKPRATAYAERAPAARTQTGR